MTEAIFLAALIVAALAVVAWKRAWFAKREPKGWFAGPLIKGKNHSVGVVAGKDGSFVFPQPSWDAGHVHYLTRETGPITGPIIAKVRIEADEGVDFLNDSGGPAWVSLYVEHKDNGWLGKRDAERLYGTHLILAPGEFILPASDWGGVHSGKVSPEVVADVLANAKRVGLVFGGGSGWGHGAFATGRATFTLTEFAA